MAAVRSPQAGKPWRLALAGGSWETAEGMAWRWQHGQDHGRRRIGRLRAGKARESSLLLPPTAPSESPAAIGCALIGPSANCHQALLGVICLPA